jgi:hypothetical protein
VVVHRLSINHGDSEAENILFTKNKKIKIIYCTLSNQLVTIHFAAYTKVDKCNNISRNI